MIDSLVIRNKRTLQEINLSVYNVDYILESAIIEPIQAQLNSISGISQDGETITKIKLETRDISIIGWLVFDDSITLKEHERYLTKFINPKEKFELLTNGRKIEFNPTSTVKLGAGNNEDNEIMRKFLIQGVCDLPFFTDEQENVKPFVNNVCEINYSGDVQTGVILVLESAGEVVNPSIINSDTNLGLYLDYTMSVNETITLYSLYGKKKIESNINGQIDNTIDIGKEDFEFIELSLGNNKFIVSADSGLSNLNATMKYESLYLSE